MKIVLEYLWLAVAGCKPVSRLAEFFAEFVVVQAVSSSSLFSSQLNFFGVSRVVFGAFLEVKQKKDKTKTSAPIERPDSYLIVPEPGRAGPAPATNRNTNDYLVQDFGLQILQSCFKNGRLQTDRTEHADMLDPFASILVHCLSSRHMPVKTTALRCLIWMLKFKLPSLERDMPNVVKTLFVHLKNYSGPGAAVSENAEFVTAVYKALSSTVRDATTSEISDKHLKVLLTYAESDFREGSKQLLAFNLLKVWIIPLFENSFFRLFLFFEENS
jgi:U3 small nucleolar RNA-associated protein 20